jgi:hypothetical protein
MKATARRIHNLVLIHQKLNTIEMDDPVEIIELGEWLIKTGKKMIHEQFHI